MSGWAGGIPPGSLHERFVRHESDQRFVRIEEVMDMRRRCRCAHLVAKPINVIEDRDPGDE